MTREEAIKILERRTTIPDAECTWEQINQAIDTAISALRSVSREQVLEIENKELKERIVNWRKYMAPTREQVEKVWRGEWQICFEDWRKQIAGDQCSKCGFQHYGTSINLYKFCPNCGAPMTDEAVQMVMERLEALYE